MSSPKKLIKAIIPAPYRASLKQFQRRTLFRGNDYYCPVCNSYTRLQKQLGMDLAVIREKQIVGAGSRFTKCPVCESSDRVRLLYLFLRENTKLFQEQQHLLHFAPEPALERVIKKHKNIDYLTADLYQNNVMEKMDIRAIPCEENTFDSILCNHVLEHIPDDSQAMSELYRVLKPGGWAILQVPISFLLEKTFEDASITTEEERQKVFGQIDHVRIYGKDYPEKLRQAGFLVKEFNWQEEGSNEFLDPRLNLNPDELIFYCTK